MNILIVPCERKIGSNRNPREYPYWEYLAVILTDLGHKVDFQNNTVVLNSLKSKLLSYDLILTIDSFIQHFCWYHGIACGVIWGPSEYRIFGHNSNINITKDVYSPRPDQFNTWWGVEHNSLLFPNPIEVANVLKTHLK